MRYSIMSVLLASLYLAGCGGDDKENTSTQTPNQPQATEDTVHTTLGNNLKVANLENVAQATFSAEYANNNPVITVKRTKDNTLSESFNFAKKIFDIEKNADYEVSLSSSKPFDSPVDVDFVVPSNLIQALSDQNALIVYVAIGGEEDDLEKEFIPIESTYNESTQRLSAILPSWLLQQNENSEPGNIIFKIGLAKTEIPAILAVAKSILLPDKGEDVLDGRDFVPKLVCPISSGVCVETSRFGHRKPGTEGASLLHKGMDFRAELNTPLISSVNGTITDIIEKSGTVVIKLKGLNKYVIYRHLNKIEKTLNSEVNTGDQIGLSGNKKNIVDGKQTTLAPHLHVELIGMKNNLACKIDTTKARTCNNLILSPLDPMPYYVESMKIKKISPQESSVEINQNFNIELQAFDMRGNQIKTEIDNSYSTFQRVDPSTGKMKTIVNPQGTLRSTNWKIEPESNAYTVKTDAKLALDTVLGFVRIGGDILSKRSSSTVTVNNLESATITAYWDGLDSLKANYIVTSIGKDPIVQADIELYYEYEKYPALRAIYDCINCDEKMLSRIAKWIYAVVECDDIARPLTGGNTRYLSLEPPIKNKKGILPESIDLETGYEDYQLASLPYGQWSGSGTPPSKVTYECKFKDTEYGISYPDRMGINVRKLQLTQNPIKFSSTLVKSENDDYYYLPFVREK